MKYDVVGINGLDYDMVLAVDHLPSHDEKISVRLLGNYPGGPTGNFACAASRLGLRVAVSARLGDDTYSKEILDELRTFEVDTRWIVQKQGKSADLTVILVDPSGERVILVVEPAEEEPFENELEIPEIFFQTHYLYLTMHSLKQYRNSLPKIRKSGVQVMIDIENTKQALDIPLLSILENCDIASFNRAGFKAFTNGEPDLSYLEMLIAGNNVEAILVTMGRDGAMGVSRSQPAVHVPGLAVPVKDTTGAGDTFNAAFLAAKVSGLPLIEAMQFSVAASALSVTKYGPKGKLSTWDEVTTCLNRGMIDQ